MIHSGDWTSGSIYNIRLVPETDREEQLLLKYLEEHKLKYEGEANGAIIISFSSKDREQEKMFNEYCRQIEE